MYSVINVDTSVKSTDFMGSFIMYKRGVRSTPTSVRVLFCQKPIIRGSSTVNGDSAHDSDPLAKEHNYVSFYVRSIKVRYEIDFELDNNFTTNKIPGYVVLFKLPYDSDGAILDKIVPRNYGTSGGMVLYSHPEIVLSYGIVSFYTKKSKTPRFLVFNKPFVVGPNDYVGILYYFPLTFVDGSCNVSSTAKVIFKPQ